MIIIFHFDFLLNFIFGCKKVADKTTTDLKGQKIRTNQNTLKTFLLRTDLISEYEAVRMQHLKICTTKQTYRQTTFFERWRAYLKSWSVISSPPLPKSERTAYCRKNLHDNKPLNKPFCFPLYKTTLGKRKKLSYKRKNIR